jgi:opacity protein-like surface antigen
MTRRRSFVFTIAALVLALSPAASAVASETVWSGLVMANNAPEPTPIPAELNRFEGTLKQLFGYNQFQVIGESRKTLKTGEEDWLAKSKYFSLHVDSKAAKHNAYSLNLQLFQEDKLLVKTDVELKKASPLVIKGPQVGDGQLVLLLVIE